MTIYDVPGYINEIAAFSKNVNFSYFKGKTLFIAGASGLVMSYLIDSLLADRSIDVTILALIHSERSALRFLQCDSRLKFVYGDVRDSALIDSVTDHIDVVINGASIVDPKGYKEHPIDTMLINLLGTKNLLELAARNGASFLLTSSCEVYGEGNGEIMGEGFSGKLDPMLVRSCYNESKRASETLCVAYSEEKGIKTYVARLSRTFGPTQSPKDTKALSQFIRNALAKQDIVLKSKGEQVFSYTYVQDVVRGIFTILEFGESMNAYNVCSREAPRLKDLASIVADIAGTAVVFDLSEDELASGYSKANFAIQDPSKLEMLGWKANVSLREGLQTTMEILGELYCGAGL